MHYRSRCHHHYLEGYDNGIFIPVDGMERGEVSSIYLKWTDCGHLNFPLDSLETVESNLREKRNYPSSPAQLYINSLDLP